jgi:methyl-accepting chemotaxis protein
MNFGVNTKIMMGVITPSILAVAAVIMGFWISSTLGLAIDQSSQIDKVLASHSHADMMHDALRADSLMAISAVDPALNIKVDDVKAAIIEHTKAFEADIAMELEKVTDPTLRRKLEDLKEPLQSYIESAKEIVGKSQNDPLAAKALWPDFSAKFTKLEGTMETATESIEELANTVRLDSESKRSTVQFLLTVILTIVAGLAVALFFYQRRQITDPIVEVTGLIIRLSKGDYKTDGDNQSNDGIERRRRKRTLESRTDELGQMARAAVIFKDNAIKYDEQRKQQEIDQKASDDAHRVAEAAAIENERASVRDSIGEGLVRLASRDLTFRLSNLPAAYSKLEHDFNQALEQLEETILSITGSSTVINVGTQDISSASSNLSRRTETQAASLEETAAAVAEITSTVKKTALGAQDARNVAESAKDEAIRSSEVVRRAISAMDNIEKSSEEINKIITVIDEISFQTNLLALNAGVEAARAGDAGKGFAVVAQEVRALAKRSAEAAREIKDLLKLSSKQVDQGVKLVAETGHSLDRILERVGHVNVVVDQIAESAQSQANGLQEVNSAVGHMDQTTQQNAAMVEQSTAATQTLALQSKELMSVVSSFTVRALKAVLAKNSTHQPAPLASRTNTTLKDSGIRPRKVVGEKDNWEEF